jgi:hypothetical protein
VKKLQTYQTLLKNICACLKGPPTKNPFLEKVDLDDIDEESAHKLFLSAPSPDDLLKLGNVFYMTQLVIKNKKPHIFVIFLVPSSLKNSITDYALEMIEVLEKCLVVLHSTKFISKSEDKFIYLLVSRKIEDNEESKLLVERIQSLLEEDDD